MCRPGRADPETGRPRLGGSRLQAVAAVLAGRSSSSSARIASRSSTTCTALMAVRPAVTMPSV